MARWRSGVTVRLDHGCQFVLRMAPKSMRLLDEVVCQLCLPPIRGLTRARFWKDDRVRLDRAYCSNACRQAAYRARKH